MMLHSPVPNLQLLPWQSFWITGNVWVILFVICCACDSLKNKSFAMHKHFVFAFYSCWCKLRHRKCICVIISSTILNDIRDSVVDQTVCHWLLTTESWDQSLRCPCGTCGGQNNTMAEYCRFFPVITIPPMCHILIPFMYYQRCAHVFIVLIIISCTD